MLKLRTWSRVRIKFETCFNVDADMLTVLSLTMSFAHLCTTSKVHGGQILSIETIAMQQNSTRTDGIRSARFRRAHVSVLALCVSAVLTACASKEELIDDSPIVRSATIVSSVKNGGVKGQFASEGARTVMTVENMRRADDAFKFSGSIMSRLSKGNSDSSIVRLDRGLIYQLNNKRKTYQECPVTGCGSFVENLTQGQSYEEEAVAEECQLVALENDLTLVKTGNQRDISGFPTEEYLLTWSMVMQDPDGKKMRSEITSRTWTTPVTGDVAQAVQMSDTFDRAYLKATQRDYPENLRRVMPADALQIMETQLLNSMDDVDNALLQKLAAMPEVQGYPISHAIEWQASDGTCATPAEPEEEREDTLDTGSVRGLLSSIGKQVVKQEIEKKKEEKLRELALLPMFTYTETVDSITIEDLRSSKLDVPAGFELTNRK